MSDDLKDKHGTTGHSWDGIEELNTPLPRWWLYTFYICIVWGIIYTILYPAWPLVNRATGGILGYSSRAELAEQVAEVENANAGINQRLAEAELTQISADPELNQFAVSAGASVFQTWCAQCHGSGAAGAKGYPNLLDDDWLWGGSIEDIHYTVSHGIRNEEDFDARYSQMPAFGADELLEDEQIDAVVNYVMSLSGTPQDPALVEEGAVVFEENCAACHGEQALGDREQGAPNLADAIWLYGGDYAAIRETVENARFGVMPAWANRLSEAQIRAVASYVHQLGGGE
ncbi:cytochrome c oxidase cbb3-type subunit 3 [Pseudooceanicola antarcticus]|uniref:Cbb3-type cytochrome c oxidase subunit n=1 Tax=Pseudooceanicola antarcticus TaxID=1247613 RepID=A0A285I0P4_9RHOB|nr:cytochrome-c oxidase, cbb3-type subunit III [Pseudooceanicola antarcticus]PJE30270.1 cytochrome-c oxidase, cbb3-type subunit III [Pseudooceanicola antarcticus]SNY41518.1 cytochrome c oxidase cbb3-type subunit 3 [Pseudooceanicola antarcticus]